MGKYLLFDVDMIVVLVYKLGGLLGIGVLLVCDLGMLELVGGYEFGYWMGIENLLGVLGFVVVLEVGGVDSWVMMVE